MFSMGWILSKIFFRNSQGLDDPDPATGLSPRQIEIVQTTWNVIRKDAKANGMKLFLTLFDTKPEYQRLFKPFADVPRSELPKSKRFLAHATSVMYALNSLVDNLQDPECLKELLIKIGISHQTRNGSPEHFLDVTVALSTVMHETLGSTVMDDKADEALAKTMDVANTVIIKELVKQPESDTN